MDLQPTLDAVGPRLRTLRTERRVTLTALAEQTGISVSTLSRLESGGRRPTLELLLPLARAHQIPIDELVAAPPTGDPRVHGRPIRQHGRIYVPLSRRPGGVQAFKLVLPGRTRPREPDPRTHEGYEWMYVVDGRVRLVLGDLDLDLEPGEAAEFDTRTPHWFDAVSPEGAELICLFGPQGERAHVRARTTNRR